MTAKAPGPLTPVAHGGEADGQAEPGEMAKDLRCAASALEPMFARLTDSILSLRPGGREADHLGSKQHLRTQIQI